ncbi:MAG: hypothetical protein QM751_16150 [Paludibacteraceae bacterium]
MKSVLFKMTILSIFFSVLLSCKKDEEVITSATISVKESSTATLTSLSVTFTPSSNTANYSIAIGTADDLEAFKAGTLKQTIKVNSGKDTTCVFKNLLPGKEYTIFGVSESDKQVKGEISTLKLSTLSVNSVNTPYAHISFSNINVMTADITVEPNNLVSKYVSLVVSKELYPEFVESYGGGDKIAFMEMLAEFQMASSNEEKTTETWELNGSTGYDFLFLVLLYDKDGKPYGEVIEKDLKAPSFIENLPKASATVSIHDITKTSVGIKITPDANALGFYAGIYTAEDFADYNTPEKINSLREELAFYGFLSLKEDDDTWALSDKNQDYVIVVAPFNANGIEGYGDLISKSFSTSSATGVAPQRISASKIFNKQTLTRQSLVQPKGNKDTHSSRIKLIGY